MNPVFRTSQAHLCPDASLGSDTTSHLNFTFAREMTSVLAPASILDSVLVYPTVSILSVPLKMRRRLPVLKYRPFLGWASVSSQGSLMPLSLLVCLPIHGLAANRAKFIHGNPKASRAHCSHCPMSLATHTRSGVKQGQAELPAGQRPGSFHQAHVLPHE